ncbi:alpha-N-acetylglucosaminidase C-terminal domain-containing protein [Micromonospora sp. DR5-3]|uniref:alpha-N-acetylglucosaminidase TIM-barrel domain-containing protein n=1 Tax=unclassified Micromonospora TaxID=2617518 RepID=UPI001CA34993|nr:MULTISPECIES: alpha-N-acetylglucosaminidase TIM-barrel domain-containing protein [unclassified Micromonospora]MCW3814351.1 alpha-N-acetylglucosaminidase C-terminal domain-containing protein [Micromonospora sp. DR5-3]
MTGLAAVLLLLALVPAAADAGKAAAASPLPAAGRPLFDVGPAHDVIRRLVGPSHAAQVGLETIAPRQGDETFRVTHRGARLVVQGSSTSALLMGFNWYLKHVAKADVSWTGNQLNLPNRLPVPGQPIEKSSVVRHRFTGNDTEDGYSGPYRTFADWERLIDVLALHGINEMFLPVGTEAVYYETLQQFGYAPDELRAWIPTPGYQPWWLLQNMSNFTEPISEHLIHERAALGRRIADRMRELGITPVLPGYFGTVPTDFAVRNPGAVTVPQGTWMGFTRPDWLAPTDPTFAQVAERFYAAQQSLLGPSTMYKMDLLHEGGRAGGVSVGRASMAVQAALEKAHPGAIWVILGWQDNPKRETVEAIDRSHMLVVDGLSDRALSPDRDADWQGAPYAFGSIWNFGGNSTMGAPVKAWNERFWDWLARPDSALDGIAIMPEASYNNPVAVEFLAELPWHDGPVDLSRWFIDYADARYGAPDTQARRAWQVLADTAYAIPPNGGRSSGHGGLFAATPSLSTLRPHSWAQAAFAYDPAAFAKVMPALLDVDESLRESDAYRSDLLEVARQSVADRSRTLLPQIKAAFEARDTAAFSRLTRTWIDYLNGLDDLVGTDRQHLVGPWLERAKAAAADPEEAARLEYDARKLITSWGQKTTDLHDYAYREWSGLLRDYYAPRWQRLFDSLTSELQTGRPAPDIDWYALAERWSTDRKAYPTMPTGDTWTEAVHTLQRLADDTYDLPLTLRPAGAVSDQPSARLVASVTNTNYYAPVTGVTFDITAPAGLEVSATTNEPREEVPPGATLEQSWALRRTNHMPPDITEAEVRVIVGFDQAGKHLTRTATAVLPVTGAGRHQLSDLPFESSRNHDGIYPIARDTVTPGTPAGNGAPLRLDGVSYSKGLGTNSNADVRFELGGNCQGLSTVVGIDDAMNHTADGDVVVRVFGDGRQLYESDVLRSGLAETGSEAVRLHVDVTGVHQLRLQVHQYDVNRYFDAVSFAVPTLTCDAPLPTMLSQNKPATASSEEPKREPAKAVDGDLSTGWFCNPTECNGKPAYLQVDLGAQHELTSVRVTPYYADRRSYLYRIEGSVDGQSWALLAAKTQHRPQSDVGDRYDVSGTYRYVRVTGFGNTVNPYTLHVQELAVYGGAVSRATSDTH